MSKIAVVIAEVADAARTIAIVRRFHPELSLSLIKERLASKLPVVELELYTNNYPDVAKRLRGFTEELSAAGVEVRLFNLEPEDQFDWSGDVKAWEITREKLMNILARSRNYE